MVTFEFMKAKQNHFQLNFVLQIKLEQIYTPNKNKVNWTTGS